jgi:hypothetical protein
MPTFHPRPCTRCGEMIPAERIEALPDTQICINCSKEIGGEFDVYLIPENLAKTGSMKKNYGGLNVKRKRKNIQPKQK